MKDIYQRRISPTPMKGLAPAGALFRLLLIPFVIFAAATLVAAGLFPAVGSAGKAAKLFTEQFLPSGGALNFPDLALTSTIYAADGSRISQVASENRIPVTLAEVNEVARHAILAVEDHDFYKHGPIDVKAILRALVANVQAGGVVQGGSTITQQLAKNFFTGNQETLQRKIQEAKDAIILEQKYTKDQILEQYLNLVYFGHGAYGIGAAAAYYFATTPANLTLDQAALLAAQISSPAKYDPVAHPQEALAQRNIVLDDMLKYDMISQTDHDVAVASPIKLSAKQRQVNTPLPYFAQFVQDAIIHPQKYDPNYKTLVNPYYKDIVRIFGATPEDRARFLYQGGLSIYTTEDPTMQRLAESAARKDMPNQGNPFGGNPEAALATVVPASGAIRALVGGPDFTKHKLNLAIQSQRQAGSAFKAFTLVAALEQGIPVGKVYDTPNPVHIGADKCGQAWSPSNAEPGSGGFVDMATATADSINVWFAQLIADTGATNVQEAARRMGVDSYAYNSTVSIPAVCAITLGSVEVDPLAMTVGYATIANDGVRCYPFAISKIVSWTGQVLFKAKPSCQQVVDPKIAATVTSLLQGVVAFGTGTKANIGRPQAGKTGTAQDYSDAWFVGYVPQLATGVWVGYGYAKSNVNMNKAPILTSGPLAGLHAFGGTLAAPIWHDYMGPALAHMRVLDFTGPVLQSSKGKVPDVVGMKQDDAVKTLQAAFWTPEVKMGASTEPAGTVYDQDPKGGTEAVQGSRVTIMVSNGKAPKVPVPDVVGLAQADAENALTAAGFVVQVVDQVVCDQSQDGIVLSQTPAAGDKAKQGSTVTIVVGRFQPPCPTPTPSPSP